MARSVEYPDLPFVAPRSWTTGRGGYSVQYVVIHHTAGAERSTSAEDGAAYDQRRTDGTSAHYHVDSNSVVQCVLTRDSAHTAHREGNRRGIQYELAGTLQSRAQWLDAASNATLTNAARQVARDCRKYHLPVRKIGPAELRAGAKGICGHGDVTLAYRLGDHTDPGPNFPWDVFLARVQQFMDGDDDVAFLDDQNARILAYREHCWANMEDQVTTPQGETIVHKGVWQVKALAADVAALKARPTLTLEDRAQIVAALRVELGPVVEAALRGVLGALDGATPPAQRT